MNFEPGQIRKTHGIIAIILGIILAVIPLSFMFRAIGILLLLIALPNFTVTLSSLNQKNPFIIVVFIKSLFLLLLAILLIVLPKQSGAFCVLSGVILLFGTAFEYQTSEDKKRYLKKEYWLLIVSAVLIVIGGFSFINKIIDIIKYGIAGILILYGLILIFTTQKVEDNFEETLRDYERRYQETYGKNEENDDIIEASYEENENSEEL